MFTLLEELNKSANLLYDAGYFGRCTNFLLANCFNEVKRTIEEFNELRDAEEMPVEYSKIIEESIVHEIMDITDILNEIENANNKDSDAEKIAKEILSKIIPNNLEVFVVSSSFEKNKLSVIYENYDGETCCIILANERLGFLDWDMLGLIGHEIAHCHPDINDFNFSMEAIRIREILCDIAGFCLAGPLFIYSMKQYSYRIYNNDKATLLRKTERYPMLACRLKTVINFSDKIWMERKVLEYINTIISNIIMYENEWGDEDKEFYKNCLKIVASYLSVFNPLKLDENDIIVGNNNTKIIQLNTKLFEEL